jgi:sarcosine oxidase subunit alpha
MLLFRVSFTGELGFEVNVPADYGAEVWEAIYARPGARHGRIRHRDHACAARREGLHHRRPGHRRHRDSGRCRVAWAIGKNKPDFVGKRSLQRASMKSADASSSWACARADAGTPLEEGAQVAAEAGQKPPMKLIGHVTSSYASSVLGYPIASALVAGGRARLGPDAVRADAGRRSRGRSHLAGFL